MSRAGRFTVQLFDMASGRWELVEVDDFVPCTMEECSIRDFQDSYSKLQRRLYAPSVELLYVFVVPPNHHRPPKLF